MSEVQEAFALFDGSSSDEDLGESIEVSAQVAREQSLRALLSWLQEDPYYALSNKVRFVVDAFGNVSAEATDDIAEGELVLTIHPRYCCRAAVRPGSIFTTSSSDFDAAHLAKSTAALMAQHSLGTTPLFSIENVNTLELQIRLMRELCLGRESFFWPYLEALNPPDLLFTLPLFWDSSKLNILTPESREMLAAAQADMRAIGALAVAPTLLPYSGRFENSFSMKRRTDAAATSSACYRPTFHFSTLEQLYGYAAAITQSRHFTNEDYVALLPAFDLFNGMPEGQNNVITERSPPRLKYDQYMRLQALQETERSSGHSDIAGDTRLVSTMFTTRSISKGEQLINNYGTLSDSELLVKYGIFPEGEGGRQDIS